jgi:hypothetical protein
MQHTQPRYLLQTGLEMEEEGTQESQTLSLGMALFLWGVSDRRRRGDQVAALPGGQAFCSLER